MLKSYKLYITIFTILVLVVFFSFSYFDFLKIQSDRLKNDNYNLQASLMDEEVSAMILQKQKSTVAIALSIANDKNLSSNLINKTIPQNYYKNLIAKISKDTLYKNIWIDILDKDATVLYRSWSDERGDNLKSIRSDLVELLEKKSVKSSISIGKFTLSIKAMVPIFNDGKFIGIIEVISHLNSIVKQLENYKIDSVVVVKKEYKKQLSFPLTKLFIDDYYIANFDASKDKMAYLKDHGVERYFHNSYKIENNYIIVSKELKDIDNKTIAYFIMFKKLKNISNIDIQFFMFKAITVAVIIFMSLSIILVIFLLYKNREQKHYYKSIIDSATNIVVINDKKTLILANKIFFKYFEMFSSVDDFKVKEYCLCEFFVDEDGYLKRYMDGVYWVDYLLKIGNEKSKVKLKIYDKFYYFSISASEIDGGDEHYSIVLSDITAEETYKKDLELLSVTDTLTNIGNRRYFYQKMLSEIGRSRRYDYSLSLIMFDIDFFKKVNDTYGHDVGDKVLIEYTQLISSQLRDEDIFCRVGGEEFVVILPHLKLENSVKVAQKLRKAVEDSKKIIPITMSFGVVENLKDEDIDMIFKRVDEALYKAKDGGRNMVVAG